MAVNMVGTQDTAFVSIRSFYSSSTGDGKAVDCIDVTKVYNRSGAPGSRYEQG